MKKRKKIITITISLIIILLKCANTYAEDLFTVEVTEKTDVQITIKCSINPEYQPNNYCYSIYIWNFGDLVDQDPLYFEDFDEYSEVIYTYNLTGTETSFNKTISLQILEHQKGQPDEEGYGPCDYVRDHFGTKSISETFVRIPDLEIEVITNPSCCFKINEAIRFVAKISASSNENTDALTYFIGQSNGESSKTGFLYFSDFNTTDGKDLGYSFISTEAGIYSFNFQLLKSTPSGTVIVYETTLDILITTDGSGGQPPGSGCFPHEQYSISTILWDYNMDNSRWELNAYPSNNSATSDYEAASGNYVYLVANKYDMEDKLLAQLPPLVNYTSNEKHNFINTNFGELNTINCPMGINGPQVKYKFFMQIYNSSFQECPLNYYEQTLIVPVPTINPSGVNQINVLANNSEQFTMPTFAEKCYALEVVNPDSPIDISTSWINLDESSTNLDQITINPGFNTTESTRNVELRICDGGITAPALLTDKNGNINSYRSIWITQSSILTDISSNTKIPSPFSNPNISETAYYGIKASNGIIAYIKDPYGNLPLELLLQNIPGGGTFYINSYDVDGKLLNTKAITYKSSTCSSSPNLTEAANYNIYIANVNTSVQNANFTVNSGQTVILFAQSEIKLKPGFQTKPGSSFFAKIKNCVASTPNSAVISNNSVLLKSAEDNLTILPNELDMRLYPNPTNYIFTLEISGDYNNVQLIEVYNSLGMRILLKEADIKQQNLIDASGWSYGVYFVRLVTTNGEIITKKLIKE